MSSFSLQTHCRFDMFGSPPSNWTPVRQSVTLVKLPCACKSATKDSRKWSVPTGGIWSDAHAVPACLIASSALASSFNPVGSAHFCRLRCPLPSVWEVTSPSNMKGLAKSSQFGSSKLLLQREHAQSKPQSCFNNCLRTCVGSMRGPTSRYDREMRSCDDMSSTAISFMVSVVESHSTLAFGRQLCSTIAKAANSPNRNRTWRSNGCFASCSFSSTQVSALTSQQALHCCKIAVEAGPRDWHTSGDNDCRSWSLHGSYGMFDSRLSSLANPSTKSAWHRRQPAIRSSIASNAASPTQHTFANQVPSEDPNTRAFSSAKSWPRAHGTCASKHRPYPVTLHSRSCCRLASRTRASRSGHFCIIYGRILRLNKSEQMLYAAEHCTTSSMSCLDDMCKWNSRNSIPASSERRCHDQSDVHAEKPLGLYVHAKSSLHKHNWRTSISESSLIAHNEAPAILWAERLYVPDGNELAQKIPRNFACKQSCWFFHTKLAHLWTILNQQAHATPAANASHQLSQRLIYWGLCPACFATTELRPTMAPARLQKPVTTSFVKLTPSMLHMIH